MNLILVCLFAGCNSMLAMTGLFFCIAHGFLSAAMFYLVDLVQRAYGTRLTTELCGIANTSPNMYNAFLVVLIFYAGVPGTLKFSCEISLFVSM
jgi:NADH:ubiquinone oxidoreductase subunit 4 (subunit M)